MKKKGFILNKKGIHGASSSCLRGRQLPSSGGMRRKPAAERGGGCLWSKMLNVLLKMR